MSLDVDQLQERNRLESLVKLGKLYCRKHRRVLDRGTFWRKRCYIGRNGISCDYISLVKEPRGGGEDSYESSSPPGHNQSKRRLN